MKCSLCDTPDSKLIHKDPHNGSLFYSCLDCGFIFRDRQFFLKFEDELKRYRQHQNDVNSIGYQNFLRPVVDEVLKTCTAQQKGLDYGCGPSSVVVHLLKDNFYDVSQYDPFFHPNDNLLLKQFDYITCTEVVEHFKNPRLEFRKLANLVKAAGVLIIKTSLTDEVSDFANWHYHRDPTHVGFLNRRSLEKVSELTGLQLLSIKDSQILFKRS